jgi:hypothetical protein
VVDAVLVSDERLLLKFMVANMTKIYSRTLGLSKDSPLAATNIHLLQLSRAEQELTRVVPLAFKTACKEEN